VGPRIPRPPAPTRGTQQFAASAWSGGQQRAGRIEANSLRRRREWPGDGRAQCPSSEPSLFEAKVRADRFDAGGAPRLTIGQPGFDGLTHVDLTHQVIPGGVVPHFFNKLSSLFLDVGCCHPRSPLLGPSVPKQCYDSTNPRATSIRANVRVREAPVIGVILVGAPRGWRVDWFGCMRRLIRQLTDCEKKAGRTGTRPAQNYPPSSPELDWNFSLNLFGGITNLD